MKNAINTFDKDLAEAICQLPDDLKSVMQFCSLVGQPIGVSFVLIVTAFVSILVGAKPVAYTAVVSLIALLLSTALKMSLRRNRPDTYIPGRWRSYSFPSGHAYGVVLMGWLLGGLALEHLPSEIAVALVSALVAFTFVTGISRIYLGAHYPTDVIGGWLLGVLVAIAIASNFPA